ncbi:MAG: succinate--CoA ligase subunit alpha [Albidovulum sp.]|nr:succinate--CoA ligase subunit alpha [Albidovulum sp.]
MAILASSNTGVIVQGMTGRAGTFYSDAAIRYGSRYAAGVRPGKGGRRHLGLPMYNTVKEAAEATEAAASLIVVPAHQAAAAMIEAIEAEIGLIVCITERVPIHDMVKVKNILNGSRSALIGPNSQGLLVPGQCKIGVMATDAAVPGRVGIVSRSASLTSEIVAQTTRLGMGQSTVVGIGGDPIHGIGFRRCLELFKEDPDTDGVVLIGEIGGTEEEEAAEYLSSEYFGKPVVALIVGRHAPEERRMGHAGTLSVLESGSARAKCDALDRAGALIAKHADDVAPKLQNALAN